MEININDVESITNDIDIYIQEFTSKLRDKEELYNNKKLVPDLLRYLYKNYVSNILNNNRKNGNRYDIELLDKLFYICCDIVHNYYCNIEILLFCCFTNINRNSIHRWKNNIDRELTPQQCDIVKNWYDMCELDLRMEETVKSMMLLKCDYGYIEPQAKPIEIVQKVTANTLPLLENNDVMLTEN